MPTRNDLVRRALIAATHVLSRARTVAPAVVVSASLAAVAFAQTPPRARRPRAAAAAAVRVAPANVFDAMYFRERADSGITPAALAAYGNSVVARRGLDFWFDACAIVRANERARPLREISETPLPLAYTLRRVGGRALNLRLATDDSGEPSGAECGECYFPFPARRVTKGELLLVAGGRRYRLERPRDFLLYEASLLDDSLRRVRRTWQLPFQTVPLGLSPDQTKLYVPLPDFDDVEWDNKLALELSDAGPRFVPRERLRLSKGEPLTNPAEAAEADATFLRFRAGARAYVIRVNDPCA